MSSNDRISVPGPRQTVTADNIKKAFVFKDRYQQRRIRDIGKMNRETLRQLGAVIRRTK
jgi:hypothetical protein